MLLQILPLRPGQQRRVSCQDDKLIEFRAGGVGFDFEQF